MAIRRFSQERLDLCGQWFANIEVAPDEWKELGPVGEGESQSLKVEHIPSGLIGVAKPGPPVGANDVCRAAHEKLAFDLAHVLDLPVPPVILWAKEMPGKYVRGRAISAWAFKQAMKWDHAAAKGLISIAAKDSVSPVASKMRVFHTWISDTDRKSDHTQVDAEYAGGELGVAFIDHAYSMSWVWKSPNHASGPCPPYMPAPEQRDVMVTACDEIAALAEGDVRRLVDRIPQTYLPDPHKGNILSNLLARKGNLRAILGI